MGETPHKQFQFLDGAIKSIGTEFDKRKVIVFQFLDGAIKSLFQDNVMLSPLAFQFLDGAIKSLSNRRWNLTKFIVSIP